MTLQQLHYVVALADHGRFVKAAKACHVTQPTLSMQVKQLEDELGVVLFDRRQQPLRPTADGEPIIAQARVVLREAAQLNQLTRELRGGLAGTYRMGVIPTLAPYLLPLFLTRFAREHPEVTMKVSELRTGDIVNDLVQGKLDLGVLVSPLHHPDIEEIPLFQEPFLAYLPKGHPLAARRRLPRKDLARQPLWVLGEGHCFREQMLSLCDRPRSAGHGNVLYESGSIETLKQLVRQGDGVTLVPALSVGDG
ncbi:MAG: LysR family transcriptional regulator, partial [Flavobacteriales bacterium]|nr:LysR family transcriptional regulator [Flavobacteriales bacterium]